MADEKIVDVVEKVEEESTTSAKKKSCVVLKYNARKCIVIVSFNDFGLIFEGIKKDPGTKVSVEYTGTIGKPDFEYKLA